MPIPDASRDDVFAAMDLFDAELRDADAWLDWEAKGNFRFAIVRTTTVGASGVSQRQRAGSLVDQAC